MDSVLEACDREREDPSEIVSEARLDMYDGGCDPSSPKTAFRVSALRFILSIKRGGMAAMTRSLLKQRQKKCSQKLSADSDGLSGVLSCHLMAATRRVPHGT